MGLNNPFNFLNKYFGWNSDLFANTGQQADSPVYEDEQQDNSVGPVQTDAYVQPDNQSYAQPAQQEQQQGQAYQLPNLTQQTQDILPTVYAPALGLGADPMNSVGMDAKWQIDPNNLMAKVDSAQKDLEAIGSGQSGDPRLNRIADISKPAANAGAWLMDQFDPDDDPLTNGTDFSSSNELYDNYYASLGYDKDAQDTEAQGDIAKQFRQSLAHFLKSGVEETAAAQSDDGQYSDLASQEREASKGKDGSWWNMFLKGSADTASNAVASLPIGMANAVDPEQAELGLTMNETDQQHANIRKGIEAAGLDDDWQRSSDELGDAWRQHQEENIDDGTMSYSNLTSNWITGKQLKAQVAAGLTQLYNLDDIDDNQVYSKRDLQLNNGYTPYLPDGASIQNMAEQNAMGIPSKIEAAIRNSRENMTSYDMDIDGQTINSNDFDYDKAGEWLAAQKAAADEVWTDPDGLELRIGDIAMDADGNARTGWTDDGRPALIMNEGDPIVFDDVDEANAWLTALAEAQSGDHHGNDMFRYDAYFPQEYTLPSGQTLSFDQVLRLYNDSISNEEEGTKAYDGSHGVSYDFGPLNIAKPSKAIDEQHDKDDWFNKYFNPMGDAVPELWDLASTSVPYVTDRIAIPMALSDAYMSSVNVDPWETRADGSMVKAADDLSEETKDALRAQGIDPDRFQDYRTGSMGAERAIANALTPASEKLFSENPLNEKGKKSLTSLISKIPVVGKSPIAKGIVGVIGEGLEEIPGNWFEEGTKNGLYKSWFGDYLRGEDGKVLKDKSGNPLVSQDKDIASRFNQPEQLFFGENENKEGEDENSRSFWDDARNSFFGGAALGGAFTTPKTLFDIHRNGLSGRANEVSDEIWDPTYDRWKKQYEQTYGPIEE